MKKIKSFLSNVWIMSILCSIIATVIVSGATALYQKINFIQAVQEVFRKIYQIAIAFLTFKIPVFVLLVSLVVLFVIKNIVSKAIKKQPDTRPKWLNYKNEHYKNWYLTWDYKLDMYSRKYDIVNLRPICRCGCELSVKGDIYLDNGRLVCPKCGATYPLLNEDTLKDFNKVLIYDIQNDLTPDVSLNR